MFSSCTLLCSWIFQTEKVKAKACRWLPPPPCTSQARRDDCWAVTPHWTLSVCFRGGPPPNNIRAKVIALCLRVIWVSKNIPVTLHGKHLPQSCLCLALRKLTSPKRSSLILCEFPCIGPNHLCRRVVPQPLSSGCTLASRNIFWDDALVQGSSRPGRMVLLVGALSHTPKGGGFDPQLVRVSEATNWYLSLTSMFLSLLSSLSKINKHILGQGLKKKICFIFLCSPVLASGTNGLYARNHHWKQYFDSLSWVPQA